MASARSVVVDAERCIGSGMCVFTASDVFDIGESGTATVIGPINPDDERVVLAVEACPTGALSLAEVARDSGEGSELGHGSSTMKRESAQQ